MIKDVVGTVFRHSLGAIGGAMVTTAVDDFGISLDTIIKVLETSEGFLGFAALFIAGALSVAKARRMKKQVTEFGNVKTRKEPKYND